MAVLDTTLIDLDDFTVEERKLLGFSATLTDSLTEKKMDEASDWIEHETQQFFIQRDIEDEEYFVRQPENRMFLRQRPVLADGFSIKDPTDDDFTTFSLEKDTGIVHGSFFPG